MTWYKVKCQLCNNNIKVEHITELPIVCPFCRQETLEYEQNNNEGKPDNNSSKKKQINRMSKAQIQNIWNQQEQIREDSKQMKVNALVKKYNTSYPVIKKILNGTWQPRNLSKNI